MSDDIELSGRLFRAGTPSPIDAESSGPIDLSDLASEIERSSGGEPSPPTLQEGTLLLWPQHAGLHASLLSTALRSGSAESWQALADELQQEAALTNDAELRGALECEAGRILIDQLGSQEEGERLIRASGSPLADTLLQRGDGAGASLAAELAALETAARDLGQTISMRAEAWIELGQLCEERTPSLARALDAYREALVLVPGHPMALALASDAAILLERQPLATELLRARLSRPQPPEIEVSLLLDLAELTVDLAERRAILEEAHRVDPREETSLRRLIRVVAAQADYATLGRLYRDLARISADPISASTALHLAFLTLVEAGEPVDDLVTELASVDSQGNAAIDLAAPLSEVALYVEQHIAANHEASGLPDNVAVLERLWRCVDDPREQALVREQLGRIRLNLLRGVVRSHESGVHASADFRLQLIEALETDLRFCLVHLPEHRWVSKALAEVLELSGDYAALIVHLQEWARTQSAGPGRAEILLQLGDVHERLRGDLPRAAEVYELAVAEDPDNASGLRALGRVYEKMRRWPQAIANLQRQAAETDDDPERLAALRRVALMAEHEVHDVDLAIATLEEVARLDPGDLLALYQLAALCRAQGRTAVLISALQMLVERLDDDIARTSILVELGEVQELQLKQRSAARECYERALSHSPGYTPALRALGRLYRDNGDLEPLLGLLSPERDPVTDPAVLALKAARVCLDELGDADRALLYLRRAYETNPDLVPARELMFQLLTAQGRVAEAYDLLRAQDPPHSDALLADFNYRLGVLAEALARLRADEHSLAYEDHALQHYRAALIAQPDHGLAFERSRRLLVAHHDNDNLIGLLETQLDRGEEDPSTGYIQLARLQLSRPEGHEAARRAYRNAYEHAPDDALVRREFELVLRQINDTTSLPALYLSAARRSSDTHFKATLLVEAVELLLTSSDHEDRELAAQAVLESLREDPGNPYAVRHLERLLSEPGLSLGVQEAVSARAVRAQSDAERAIFYLESAELLERAGALEQARRAYLAAQDAMPKVFPAEAGLERIASGRQRVEAAKQARASIHELLTKARDLAVRAGTGDASAAGQAIALIREMLEREPEHRDALALGRALAIQLPESSEILEVLRHAFPRVTDATTRHDMGLFLAENAARLEDALQFYEAAAQARPDGKQAMRGLVNAYRQLGDDQKAADATERLLQLFDPGEPSAVDLRMGLATFLASSPATLPRALDHAKLVFDARPDDPRAISLMVDLYERADRRPEAAELLDRLMARERNREKLHDIHLRKARILTGVAGHESQALASIERAASLSPGSRETITLLIDLLEHTGQLQRIAAYLQPIRSALQSNISRGAVSLRDFQILARVAERPRPELAEVSNLVLHAIEPSSNTPMPDTSRPATLAGLQRVLGTPSLRVALYSSGEPAELHELIRAIDPLLWRLQHEFPAIDPADAMPRPSSLDLRELGVAVASWGRLFDVERIDVGACSTHNTTVLFRDDPAALRIATNLWQQGDPLAWRGLAAIAFARQAYNAPRARALSPMDLDLLLAASFESVEVFNAITADPDPRRLRDLAAQLGKVLPRRSRKTVERCCQVLSSHAFAPSETARALLATDLRMAVLLSGDIAACLGAACLLDGVVGGSMKQRVSRSRSGQELLGFLLGDTYLALRQTISEA